MLEGLNFWIFVFWGFSNVWIYGFLRICPTSKQLPMPKHPKVHRSQTHKCQKTQDPKNQRLGTCFLSPRPSQHAGSEGLDFRNLGFLGFWTLGSAPGSHRSRGAILRASWSHNYELGTIIGASCRHSHELGAILRASWAIWQYVIGSPGHLHWAS